MAPGSSRGYACPRVALQSIRDLASPRLGQSQASVAFVPPSADFRDARWRFGSGPDGSAVPTRRPVSPTLSLLSARAGMGRPHRARMSWARLLVDFKSLRAAHVTRAVLRRGTSAPAGVRGGGACLGGGSWWGPNWLASPFRSEAPGHLKPVSLSSLGGREPRWWRRQWGVETLPPRPTFHSTTTSHQTRQPAEFKHITKRRKRN